jgi:hypothetical protein
VDIFLHLFRSREILLPCTNFLPARSPLQGFALLGISSLAVAASPNPAVSQTPEKPLCRIEVDRAHPSTYFKNRGLPAVKVNARSVCNIEQREVVLTVKLYKVGLFFDHLVASTQTNPGARLSSGLRIENNNTYAICKNKTLTRYYGIATATATIAGKRVAAPPARSLQIFPIKCGT